MSAVRWFTVVLACWAASGCLVGSDEAEPACGCGRAPMCGQACESSCGCCGCTGSQFCRDGAVYGCASTCYALIETCARPEQCVQDANGRQAFCADDPSDCANLRAVYDRTVESLGMAALSGDPLTFLDDAPYCSEDCQVLPGHCEIGLGQCYYVYGYDQPDPLAAIARLYEELGCSVPQACECGAPPSASCESMAPSGATSVTAGTAPRCVLAE